jgi:hypothetical protein
LKELATKVSLIYWTDAMTIDGHSKTLIDQFFSAITTIQSAYLESSFTYLAIRRSEGFTLITGRVTFNNAPTKIPLTHFQSANIRAGHYTFAELKTDPRKFIETISSGKIATPAGELLFPPDPMGHHDVYYQPFHQQGLQNQNRIDVLSILGAPNDETNRMVHHDWEVRASPRPYDGVQELIGEYQTGLPRSDRVAIEVVAPNVAVFDFSSAIGGTKAQLIARVAKNGNPDLFTLGYRVLSQGKVHSRGTIPGSNFKWSDTDEYRIGKTELKVPNAAVIQCIARYADIAEHHGWAVDPNTVQNPRRAVYETFDKNLDFLREVIGREGRVRARDLEAVVGWLLWMLGFSVANLGGTDRTQDAADLLVTTPAGQVAVIEVTTGQRKTSCRVYTNARRLCDGH